MASFSTGRHRDRKSKPSDKTTSNTDLLTLLHPELLSRDFIRLVLDERKITTRNDESHDRLTELYLRHVIPLSQRALPDSRWGRRMARTRARQTPAGERSHGSSDDQGRKRPLIVFDGSSSHAGPVRVKKPEGPPGSRGAVDRLKPPPSMNLSNPVRKLSSSSSHPSSSSSSTSTASVHQSTTGNGSLSSPPSISLKREADGSGTLKSPDIKKKIQHVTWP